MTIPSRLPIYLYSIPVVLALLVTAMPASAQSAADPAATPPATSPTPTRDETEQNLVTVPTTQPMRRFGSHFRITHRFARDWGRGDVGDLAADLFGLDSGAIIGLDYRFAPTSKSQVAAYRTMLYKTIQFSGRYDGWKQSDRMPVALSPLLSVEGADNFRSDYATALGVVASRSYGRKLALYASPTFVWNSVTPSVGVATGHEGHDHADIGDVAVTAADDSDENTFYVGLGTRMLMPGTNTAFITLEFSPRVTGFAPGRGTWGVGIEKHTRGHLFQLNFSNSFGTTYGQLARGGERSNVYLGFNIARKF